MIRLHNPSTTTELLYRGTQGSDPKGFHHLLSLTPSIEVAIIWSAVPPDLWRQQPAHFTPTSTVHVYENRATRTLDLPHNHTILGDLLHLKNKQGELALPNMTGDDLRRIARYMHDRLIGYTVRKGRRVSVPGGEFNYQIYDDYTGSGLLDEENEPLDDETLHVPFSLRFPYTPVRVFLDNDDGEDRYWESIAVDTFILADSPTLARVARAAGYDMIRYPDIFQGATPAVTQKLLGKSPSRVEGVEIDEDIHHNEVPFHTTYRPLTPEAAPLLRSVPVTDLPEART